MQLARVFGRVVPGVGVAIALALLARLIADSVSHGAIGLPPISLSPVLFAVLIGMLWRNTVGVPAWTTEGLQWAMHSLLRTGIALVGLRLTLSGAGSIAVTALPIALACLATGLAGGVLVSNLFAVPRRLGVLLAIGTAVCGCTAVVAVAPVIRSRGAETAFAVTCVVLFGCLGMLFYPWLAGALFADSPVHAGVFLGTAIHDTSQVVGSALIYSQAAHAPDALAAASVAKLLRNLSLAFIIPLAGAWSRRHEHIEERAASDSITARRPSLIPLFVAGFIACLVLRTLGDQLLGSHSALWHALVNTGETASDVLLVCGMTALGLSVSFGEMWRIGWRPLAAGWLVAFLVGTCSLGLNLLEHHLGW
jgi:uncharacterized integral membrane protein (TIGR00698 family)